MSIVKSKTIEEYLMTTVTLSSRGQIVVPSLFRKKLGLREGDQIAVELDEGSQELTLKRVESIDEMSARFNSWIKSGTPPLMDTRALYRTRKPRV
jgi:AbrB family looped-hinge helix DNA binding protein